MTNPKHTSSDPDMQEAIAWANKVIKAKGTAYTPASRNAAAFILASCDRIEALEAENERLREALGLADAALRGANMNMNVVERKLRAALEARHH